MQTHPLRLSKGRDHVLAVRSELFAFPEVLDVFVTGSPDVLVVVCSGRPRPAQWLRTLRAAGYEGLARPHAKADPPASSEPVSSSHRHAARSSSENAELPMRRVAHRPSSVLRPWIPTTRATS